MQGKSFFVLLTNQCNLSCKHCYNRLDSIKAEGVFHGKDTLTIEQLASLFLEFSKKGFTKVLFSGGEALLRPDIAEIIDQAKKNGLKTALFTNGHLLTEPLIKKLSNAGLNEVRISFNELVWCKSRKDYEKIFSVQTRYVSLLKNSGISVGFVFIVSGYNVDYVIETFDKVQSLGATMKIQPLYIPDHFNEFSKIAASAIPKFKWDELLRSFTDRIQKNGTQTNSEDVYGLTEEITKYIKFLSKIYESGKKPRFCPTGPLLVIDAEGNFHPCLFRPDIVCGHISDFDSIRNINTELDKYLYFSNGVCYKEECLSAFR